MSERVFSKRSECTGLLLTFTILFLCTASAHAADPFDIRNFTIKNNDGSCIIHIPAGVYSISRPLLIPSNTILEGDGQETVLEPAPGFSGEHFISNADFARGSENITIRSLKVRFNIGSLSGGAPGVLRFENIRNLGITGISMELDTAYYGIDLSANIRDASVNGCVITNSGGGGGIQIRNRDRQPEHASMNITIAGNTISSKGDEPLAVFGWLGRVSGIKAAGNTITAGGASFGISAYGIDTPGHTGTLAEVSILNNIVSGGKHGGIGVKGGAYDILLDGNTVSETENDGIFLDSGGKILPRISKIRVYRNTLTGIGRHGVYAAGADITISKNRINGCKGAGIYICEFPGSRIDVTDNSISRASRGMIVDGAMKGSIAGNIMDKSGNVLYLK